MRVGVIGVGTIGRHHARIYSQLPGAELIGIADSDGKVATAIAESYNCRPYTDYVDLLEQRPDAASIAVPTTLHYKIAMDAIRRGVNILVEKPIADTVENATRMIEAAKQGGVKLAVGHIERFNPAITRLKELVDAGQLGDIISISAKRVGPYTPRIRDVGIILDLGTHDIDIMSYLCGQKLREVYTLAGSVVHNHEDHAIIMLNFGEGVSGVIETNWLTPHKVRNLTVIGSRGIAEVNYLDSTLKISDSEWIREAKIEKDEPLKLELRHFVDCVRQDKEPLVTGADGKRALEVALAAVVSYQNGKACEIP